MKAKAVFFDRDGVLNVDVAYLYKIEDLRWIDGAREAVAYLTQLGYKIFIVTNQSAKIWRIEYFFLPLQMKDLNSIFLQNIACIKI